MGTLNVLKKYWETIKRYKIISVSIIILNLFSDFLMQFIFAILSYLPLTSLWLQSIFYGVIRLFFLFCWYGARLVLVWIFYMLLMYFIGVHEITITKHQFWYKTVWRESVILLNNVDRIKFTLVNRNCISGMKIFFKDGTKRNITVGLCDNLDWSNEVRRILDEHKISYNK